MAVTNTPVTRREVISWVLITVALLAIAVGFLKLQDQQSSLHDESAARAAGECTTLMKAVEPLRQIIEFTTKPADLTGLEGDRLKVVTDLNVTRAKAREQLLPLIPVVHCRKTT